MWNCCRSSDDTATECLFHCLVQPVCVDIHKVPAIALQVHQTFFVFVGEEEGGHGGLCQQPSRSYKCTLRD